MLTGYFRGICFVTRSLSICPCYGVSLFSLSFWGVIAFAQLAIAQQPQPAQTVYSTKAEKPKCRNDISKDDGYKVHSVVTDARWGWAPQIFPVSNRPEDQILVSGDDYDPAKRSATHNAVRAALKKDRQQDFELDNRGTISVFYVDSCVQEEEPAKCQADLGNPVTKCVNVTINPVYLQFDLYHSGSNTLPIPRSNRPTFFDLAPRPLLALNPTFGSNYDREYGLSQVAGISTNLLDLGRLSRGEHISERQTKLQLDLKGRQSLNKSFYDADSRLSLIHRQPGKFFEMMSMDGSFGASQQPLAEGKYFNDLAKFGGRLTMRPRFDLLNSITLAGKYRWSGNRFFSRDGALSELVSENAFEGRAIMDGRIAGGFTRLGIWGDVSSPQGEFHSYHRLVGILGYQKEFPIEKRRKLRKEWIDDTTTPEERFYIDTNQTIGVDAIIGGGRAWGDTPEYARFYGGNSMSNFLYDAADSSALASFPLGPLLRSFGSGQAGAEAGAQKMRGGTSFWHLNLNVAVPVPAWSYPLVPPVVVIDDDQGEEANQPGCGHTSVEKNPGSLKQIIKGQVRTARSFLINELMERDNALTDQQAAERADKILKEICPAVYFIADRANIFSIKPLFMFDVGRLDSPGSLDDRTRVAVGGGVQLTIVVAKFELGYLRTVHGISGDSRGSFVMRIVFQNLF